MTARKAVCVACGRPRNRVAVDDPGGRRLGKWCARCQEARQRDIKRGQREAVRDFIASRELYGAEFATIGEGSGQLAAPVHVATCIDCGCERVRAERMLRSVRCTRCQTKRCIALRREKLAAAKAIGIEQKYVAATNAAWEGQATR